MKELQDILTAQVNAARARLENLPDSVRNPPGLELDYWGPVDDAPALNGTVWKDKVAGTPKARDPSVDYG